jgi:hypothetical protein
MSIFDTLVTRVALRRLLVDALAEHSFRRLGIKRWLPIRSVCVVVTDVCLGKATHEQLVKTCIANILRNHWVVVISALVADFWLRHGRHAVRPVQLDIRMLDLLDLRELVE